MSDRPSTIPLSVPVMEGGEWAYVKDCLDTGWVSSGGSYVSRFESAIAELTDAKAVACQSGTAALHVALLLLGVGPGDEVIVPTVTFIATCNAVAYTGATPVFLDCDDRLGLDPAALAAFLAEECERTADGVIDRATGRTIKAIMPVHIFGVPCDMDAIAAAAEAWGLPMVEDAAESLGSSWTEGRFAGRHTGTAGALGVFSFNGNKIATCGGGGMLVTADEALAERANHLMTTAKTDAVRFVHDEVGYNYRLTNIQAALGLAQVEGLERRVAVKRRNLETYRELLGGQPGLTVMSEPAGVRSNAWFYSLLIEPEQFGADREHVMAALDTRGIQTRPMWLPNHLQQPYRQARSWRIERATWYWERLLNLPCSPDLTEADVRRVCDAIREVGELER